MKVISWFFIVVLGFSSLLRAESFSHLEVKLIMSVDWEGVSLDDKNLKEFKAFRENYPNIKIIHFLNAAYFTQPRVKTAEVAEKIRSVIKPGDELGLHIHALENLLEVAGVPFREDVTYWGMQQSQPFNGLKGHDVPLSLFTVDEMRRLTQKSLEILRRAGFHEIQSFRAGGWIASPAVLEAIRREGLLVDSSAVSTEILASVVRKDQPLYMINKELWPDQTPFKYQPYEINTSAGTVLEFPNNIGLADYISARDAFAFFEKMVEQNFGKTKTVIFHFGFHQETAKTYLPVVRTLLNKIYEFQQRYRVQVNSATFTDVPRQLWAHHRQEAKSCVSALK